VGSSSAWKFRPLRRRVSRGTRANPRHLQPRCGGGPSVKDVRVISSAQRQYSIRDPGSRAACLMLNSAPDERCAPVLVEKGPGGSFFRAFEVGAVLADERTFIVMHFALFQLSVCACLFRLNKTSNPWLRGILHRPALSATFRQFTASSAAR